ncbi:cyclase-associated protein 1-like protein [Carex littledalei]|uniref:Cyclase-associated protein 1-like protein n=1 Tax=Carex littledalei TaxID=544730 RepID=A0A833V423_9POAL|nr:cyclase-associated protein 1-like protein [Carex littledalei]
MSAVFQEINSGKPVTTGLKKVTGDMKTKNRTDRMVGTALEMPAPRAGSFSFKTGPPQNGSSNGPQVSLSLPPICPCIWVVENQVGKKNLVIDDCDSKQSVYVFGCKDSVLQVKGKVNNITLDKCTKTGILFTDVVAAFEVVNCNGVEVQCQIHFVEVVRMSCDDVGDGSSCSGHGRWAAACTVLLRAHWYERALVDSFSASLIAGRVMLYQQMSLIVVFVTHWISLYALQVYSF